MVEPEEIGHDLSAAKYNFIRPFISNIYWSDAYSKAVRIFEKKG